MVKTEVYDMRSLESFDVSGKNISYIFALSDESRSQSVMNHLIQAGANFCQLLIIKYYEKELPKEIETIRDSGCKVIEISIGEELIGFLEDLMKISNEFWEKDLLIDISCIHVPEIFTLLKYIKMQQHTCVLNVFYSMPYDYVFKEEPFTSYKSFCGDLNMFEMLGFSGECGCDDKADLYLFMGFESALGLMVVENCGYNNLNLINNLPSFFPKYKDISTINNYQLMTNNKYRSLYTPADNPFETYNLLNGDINLETPICIAPLSTKPVALGVCLYALEHDGIRVVFPISNEYNRVSTYETYKTYVYTIPINV